MSIRELIIEQLSEIELMQSMYPNDSEFVIEDPTVVVDMTNYIDGHQSPINALKYYVNITTELSKFQLSCSLSSVLSSSNIVNDRQLYVRSHSLNRDQQRQLNEDMTSALIPQLNSLEEQDSSAGRVLNAIQWLRVNGDRYLTPPPPIEKASRVDDRVPTCPNYIDRLWIYSHHIYNKVKRKDILQLAKDLNIGGFCLPGKPGIICIEGAPNDCQHFWDAIKQMTWKKIGCKKREQDDGPNWRRFPGAFKEVAFVSAGASNNGHTDFGAFYDYLEEHDSGYIFKELFNVDGRH